MNPLPHLVIVLRMLQAILDTEEDWEDASDCSGVVSKSPVRKSDTDDSVSDMVQTDISGLSLSVVVDNPIGVVISPVNGTSIIEKTGCPQSKVDDNRLG